MLRLSVIMFRVLKAQLVIMDLKEYKAILYVIIVQGKNMYILDKTGS